MNPIAEYIQTEYLNKVSVLYCKHKMRDSNDKLSRNFPYLYLFYILSN